jgi:3-phenylpropionate/trans-cinnamate dioxygenase subunit alpha
VLVVRDTAGQVRAFLNVCRHRGNRLCRADAGNAASFTCAYHGWTYQNDGRLTGVPYFKEAYHSKLNRERWGLVPVARFDSYKGLFFATFDPEAPPLREYLGEMSWYIDTFVDRREGGIEIVATHKWVMPCNWKFPAENFGGDAYHVRWSHGAAIATGFSVGSTASPAGANRMVSPGNGHVLIWCCQVNLSRSEKAEAGCAITLPPPHSAIRSPPRIGRSAASIARRDGVEG